MASKYEAEVYHCMDPTLELYERAAVASLLRGSGFRVRFRRSYGSYRLPRGHAVAVATRV